MNRPDNSLPKAPSSLPKNHRNHRWLPRVLFGIGLSLALLVLWILAGENVKNSPTPLSAPARIPPPTIEMVEPSPSLAPPEKSAGTLGWIPDGSPSLPSQENTPMAPEGPPEGNVQYASRLNEEGIRLARIGRLEEALNLFEKGSKANPKDAKIWNNLGLALKKQGRGNEAIKAYTRAIELDPGFALVYKNLGIALEQINKKPDALKAYQQYCRLNPSAPDLEVVRKRISMLTN